MGRPSGPAPQAAPRAAAPPGPAMPPWVEAVRPFSLTATIVPVSLGGALAWKHGAWDLRLFVVTLVAALFIQVGTNMVNSYVDFKKGVDTPESSGASRVLVDGRLEPEAVYRVGIACFVVAFLLGLSLVAARGWPVLAIGLLGLAAGYTYTATPIAYKYYGLGAPFVFLLMGPLMVWGAYFVQTGGHHGAPLWAALPVGFLVAAILHGNDLRDIPADSQVGVTTLSNRVGAAAALKIYGGLLAAAFVSMVVGVAVGALSPWALLALLTAGKALSLWRSAREGLENPASLQMLDARTAQLHLLFGLILIVTTRFG